MDVCLNATDLRFTNVAICRNAAGLEWTNVVICRNVADLCWTNVAIRRNAAGLPWTNVPIRGNAADLQPDRSVMRLRGMMQYSISTNGVSRPVRANGQEWQLALGLLSWMAHARVEADTISYNAADQCLRKTSRMATRIGPAQLNGTCPNGSKSMTVLPESSITYKCTGLHTGFIYLYAFGLKWRGC